MDIQQDQQTINIVLVGDAMVGKTYILSRVVEICLPKYPLATIGVEFATKTIAVSENEQVKLQFWDTPGVERFRAIVRAYFRKSAGAILVYDITNAKTFESLGNWIVELRSQAQEELVIMLVGNKKDIVDKNEHQRKISSGYASDFAQQNNLLFEEVSAQQGENIENTITRLASEIIQRKRNSTNMEKIKSTKGEEKIQ